MTDTKIMLLGVLAIFVGSGLLCLKMIDKAEVDAKHDVCVRTCFPYWGEPISGAKLRCTCDLMRKSDDEDTQ